MLLRNILDSYLIQGRRIAKSVATAVAIDCNRQLQSAVWKGRTRIALARAVANGRALELP